VHFAGLVVSVSLSMVVLVRPVVTLYYCVCILIDQVL
jgi:hypothetical protein